MARATRRSSKAEREKKREAVCGEGSEECRGSAGRPRVRSGADSPAHFQGTGMQWARSRLGQRRAEGGGRRRRAQIAQARQSQRPPGERLTRGTFASLGSHPGRL